MIKLNFSVKLSRSARPYCKHCTCFDACRAGDISDKNDTYFSFIDPEVESQTGFLSKHQFFFFNFKTGCESELLPSCQRNRNKSLCAGFPLWISASC